MTANLVESHQKHTRTREMITTTATNVHPGHSKAKGRRKVCTDGDRFLRRWLILTQILPDSISPLHHPLQAASLDITSSLCRRIAPAPTHTRSGKHKLYTPPRSFDKPIHKATAYNLYMKTQNISPPTTWIQNFIRKDQCIKYHDQWPWYIFGHFSLRVLQPQASSPMKLQNSRYISDIHFSHWWLR